jgi:hypothetical protein
VEVIIRVVAPYATMHMQQQINAPLEHTANLPTLDARPYVIPPLRKTVNAQHKEEFAKILESAQFVQLTPTVYLTESAPMLSVQINR